MSARGFWDESGVERQSITRPRRLAEQQTPLGPPRPAEGSKGALRKACSVFPVGTR